MNDSMVVMTLCKGAYRHVAKTGRHYKLTSGQVSDEYLDVKNALLAQSFRGVIEIALADLIEPKFAESASDQTCDLVAGMELGGPLLAAMVADRLELDCLVIRKEDHTHGNSLHGVIGLDNLHNYTGKGKIRTWLIEDVITTGGSVIKSLDRLNTIAPHLVQMVGVAACVDREQDGIQAIKTKYPDIEVRVLTTISEIRAEAHKC